MNYSNCTVEELAEHVNSVTCQSVSQTLAYHRKRGNKEIVDKIAEARKLARKQRLTKMLEELQ